MASAKPDLLRYAEVDNTRPECSWASRRDYNTIIPDTECIFHRDHLRYVLCRNYKSILRRPLSNIFHSSLAWYRKIWNCAMKLIKRLGKVMNAMVLIDSTQCRSVLRPSVLLTNFDLLVTQERRHRLKIVEESESILDGVVHMALDWLSSHATCAANIVLPLRANPILLH